ncbi:hypothetical protein R3P38DRAFT_2772108 [Favolaschia claudopus]|uniref:Uncharacterized protein n=1 Tax=Favolaschia claudopus TaxID=2862362 RepID=A0AAW0C866_9AGAR
MPKFRFHSPRNANSVQQRSKYCSRLGYNSPAAQHLKWFHFNPPSARSPAVHRSYISDVVASARAHSGTPSAHPLYRELGATTHHVLQSYNPAYSPGCLERTYQQLQFLDSKIGRCIHALNSTVGVTSDVVQGLIDNTIRCSACSCQYSFDGYNAHIRDGLCGNKPNPTPVTPASHRAPYYGLDTRELPPGKRLEKFAEFLDTPIGASMLEWNSKLGIPTDV